MKTIQFSTDCAEWTRYFYEIEVSDDATAEEIKELVYGGDSSDWKDCGTKCLGNVEMIDTQYNFPEGLK